MGGHKDPHILLHVGRPQGHGIDQDPIPGEVTVGITPVIPLEGLVYFYKSQPGTGIHRR